MIQLSESQMLAWLASFVLPLFRILALMGAAPVLQNRAFTGRAKVATAALIALLVAPWAPAPEPAVLLGPGALILIVREVIIGLMIGFAARLLFGAFELAGEAIGLQMGLSFAGFFDPQSVATNAVGRFINTMALLVFISIDGPLSVIATLIESFRIFPASDLSFEFIARHSPLQLGSEVFALGLNLAMPFIALLLFINLSLGVISRVAPQFNIFAVGFPVTLGAGMLLLTLGMPLIAAPLQTSLERILEMLTR